MPESESDAGETGASLTSAMLLVRLPVAFGVKLTENFADCPGDIVNGELRPLTLKPVPGPANCVMLRPALPGLLTVTSRVLLTPTGTLPKLITVGTTEIKGCTPLPLSKIVIGA